MRSFWLALLLSAIPTSDSHCGCSLTSVGSHLTEVVTLHVSWIPQQPFAYFPSPESRRQQSEPGGTATGDQGAPAPPPQCQRPVGTAVQALNEAVTLYNRACADVHQRPYAPLAVQWDCLSRGAGSIPEAVSALSLDQTQVRCCLFHYRCLPVPL